MKKSILVVYQNIDKVQIRLVQKLLEQQPNVSFLQVHCHLPTGRFRILPQYSKVQGFVLDGYGFQQEQDFYSYIRASFNACELTAFIELGNKSETDELSNESMDSDVGDEFFSNIQQVIQAEFTIPFTHFEKCMQQAKALYNFHRKHNTTYPDFDIQKGNLLACLYQLLDYFEYQDDFSNDISGDNSSGLLSRIHIGSSDLLSESDLDAAYFCMQSTSPVTPLKYVPQDVLEQLEQHSTEGTARWSTDSSYLFTSTIDLTSLNDEESIEQRGSSAWCCFFSKCCPNNQVTDEVNEQLSNIYES